MRPSHLRRRARPIDQRKIAESNRGLEDSRQWISLGLVTTSGDNEELVVFDEEEGTPLVRVLLEPSKVPIVARVAGQVAGNGEGDWFPFVEGDEVIVALPQGSERAGGVILGRLSNGVQKFPMESVAGQDPTTNSFSFSRRKTPRIEEFNGPILFRNAQTGALFGVDSGGVFTVRTGDAAVFQMSPDVIALQGPSDSENAPELTFQMNVASRHITMTVGDAIFNISAADAEPEPNNILSVPGNLTIGAGGNASSEHLMTVEAFWHGVQQFMTTLAATLAAIPAVPPLTGPSLAAVLTAPANEGWLNPAIALAAASPMSPILGATLSGSFQVMAPKTLSPPFQTNPGLGSATIIVG